MNAMTGIEAVPPPSRPESEFPAYGTERRNAPKPVLERLLDLAQSAGWNRRAAALMFLAAHHVSAASRLSRETGIEG
jgi:hypothetical protein